MVYYDTLYANGAGACGDSDTMDGGDLGGADGAGSCGIGDAGVFGDAPGMDGAGAGGGHDSRHYAAETIASAGAALIAGVCRLLAGGTLGAHGAGAVAGAGVASGHDVAPMRGGAIAATADTLDGADEPGLAAVARAGAVGLSVLGDTAGMHGAASVGIGGRHYYDNISAARGAGFGGGGEAWSCLEEAGARGAARPVSVDTADGGDTQDARGAGKAAAAFDNPSATTANLIAAIRRNAAAFFTECREFPEAIPLAPISKSMPLPYAVILAREPKPEEFGVNQEAWTVPIDIIYVTRTVSSSAADTPQVVRRRLDAFLHMLVLDYQQFAGWTQPACRNTRIVGTPADRENEYQDRFNASGQSITVMLAAVECLQITERLPV